MVADPGSYTVTYEYDGFARSRPVSRAHVKPVPVCNSGSGLFAVISSKYCGK